MVDDRERSRDTGKTIGGAVLILAVGVALGVGWNAMGLASRPPRGLPWIAPPQATPSLEALQPRAAAAVQPAPRVAAEPDSAPAPAVTPPAPVAHMPRSPAIAPPAPVTELPAIPDVSGPLTVELPAFKRLYDANAALVVDAREPATYDQGHIAGAINLPYNDALADRGRVERLVPGPRAIVVYCSGATCELSLDLAQFLVESGKRNVLVYGGGYGEWRDAGYPIERGSAVGARP